MWTVRQELKLAASMTHCAGAWSGGRIQDALHDRPSLSRDCPMFSETEVLSLREAAPRAGGRIPSLLDLHFCDLGQPCPANYMHISMASLVCGSFTPGSTLALPQGVSIHKMGSKARTRWKGLCGSDGCSGFSSLSLERAMAWSPGLHSPASYLC